MDRCTGRRDITVILLKAAFHTVKSVNTNIRAPDSIAVSNRPIPEQKTKSVLNQASHILRLYIKTL